MIKKIQLFLLLTFITNALNAQILKPVKWTFASKKLNDKEAVIFMKATIDKGWHLYAQNMSEGGPIPTKFTFTPSKTHSISGKTIEPKSKSSYEKVFSMNVSYFDNEVVFQQRIKLNGVNTIVKGTVEFMACDNIQCTPPTEVDFAIQIK
ncbi:protein-disulfide reductase DsbD domain-containing protein [Sphingobacterium hotanense]|uniref:Sugar transporter n=1 Tax=Sphingobacterium hotanense TaxID=649196 RepID=A0ABT7NKE7_9SPHI|nr:protein-disulfide reductase DsbD domain-containing protein [Sphingobacterium hotanense]MDM1047703.1 sugar transporter [Sphingobacterium hotanense]